MSKIIVPASCNIDLSFEAAPFHHRFLAWLLDIFIMLGYILVMSFFIGKYMSHHHSTGRDLSYLYNLSSVEMIAFSPILVYHLLSELLLNGQSIGKRLLGMKVISETGTNASLYQYLIRWLLRVVDFGFSMGFIGFVTSIATKKGQRLGDVAAGTLVVKTRVKSDLGNTIFQEVETGYVPVYANVLRLSDRDMNVIKNILDASRRDNKLELAERTSDKIRSVLQITQHQHPIEFLETILKDYNALADRK
ncbi:RDD family protein [Parasediminibacterium sp. JCM 36343]|uniref:RDD family protein n=1 Tax=Parasediminibacterium sp. JCM 36343 TaxID=3374279 RepID=UPI003978253C